MSRSDGWKTFHQFAHIGSERRDSLLLKANLEKRSLWSFRISVSESTVSNAFELSALSVISPLSIEKTDPSQTLLQFRKTGNIEIGRKSL